MLEKQEIMRIAKLKGLSIKNTEKDYLLELVLYLMCREVGKKMVFKGGTALYKLHSLNRFSEDLDFTLDSGKFDVELLFKKIMRKLQEIRIFGKIAEIADYKNQKNIKLELKGPLFDGNVKNISRLTINISLKERPAYAPENRTIFSQYPDIPSFDVFVMPPDELLAEKIRTILTRDKARDVYDLWFLLNKNAKFDLKLVNKKLKLYKQSFSRRELEKKIKEKAKEWNKDLSALIMGSLPDFLFVEEEIWKKLGL